MARLDKQNLDVVMTVVIRPEVLNITLNSFKIKLLDQFNVRLIVNVDPIGQDDCSQNEVVNLCKKYFPNVVSRTPKSASFSKAVFWCWQQIESEYFFHLEDDWCLKKKVSSSDLMDKFSQKDVVSVRLNITRNSKFTTDGNHVYCGRMSLNPSMIRSVFIREYLTKFDILKDPEKQFIGNETTESFQNPIFLMFGSAKDQSLVIDIGKKWRNNFGFSKWGNTSNKIIWEHSNKSQRFTWLLLKYRFFLLYWTFLYCNKSQKTIDGRKSQNLLL